MTAEWKTGNGWCPRQCSVSSRWSRTSYSIQDCPGYPLSKHLLEPITRKFPCNRNAHRFFQPRVGVFPDTDSKRLLEQVSRRFFFTENYYTIFLPSRIVCT